MASTSTAIKIPGTTPFDGEQAKKGYALNKMCFSFNTAENRAAFKQDEEAYMKKYNLTEPQAAVQEAARAVDRLFPLAGPTAMQPVLAVLRSAGDGRLDVRVIDVFQQREAIRARNVLQLIAAGGNAYYLAKFAGIFGLDMQDIGAQQTGMTKDQFKAKLVAAGR